MICMMLFMLLCFPTMTGCCTYNSLGKESGVGKESEESSVGKESGILFTLLYCPLGEESGRSTKDCSKEQGH